MCSARPGVNRNAICGNGVQRMRVALFLPGVLPSQACVVVESPVPEHADQRATT